MRKRDPFHLSESLGHNELRELNTKIEAFLKSFPNNYCMSIQENLAHTMRGVTREKAYRIFSGFESFMNREGYYYSERANGREVKFGAMGDKYVNKGRTAGASITYNKDIFTITVAILSEEDIRE